MALTPCAISSSRNFSSWWKCWLCCWRPCSRSYNAASMALVSDSRINLPMNCSCRRRPSWLLMRRAVRIASCRSPSSGMVASSPSLSFTIVVPMSCSACISRLRALLLGLSSSRKLLLAESFMAGGLFRFVKTIVDQCHHGIVCGPLVCTVELKIKLCALAGCEHHYGHDVFSVDHAVGHTGANLAAEWCSGRHSLCCGARMKPPLAEDCHFGGNHK